MNTPLQLEQYFFPVVKVTADPQFPEEKENVTPNYKVRVQVVDTEVESRSYQVSVEISCQPENEERRIPYIVELMAVGFFKVSKDWPEPVKLLKINGAAILYGAAREYLITISARGPWGAVMLPMASFLNLYNEEMQQKELAAKQAATVVENDQPPTVGKRRKS